MKRISRKKRRRRVIRNWILLILALALLAAVIIVLIKGFKNHGNVPQPSGQQTTAPVSTDSGKNTQQTTASAADTTTADLQNDDQAPVIRGQENIYVALGAKVKYKSYVYVEDNLDPEPKLEIDNSNVDLSREGEYVVVYTATDAAGNSSSKSMKVIVGAEEQPNVDEAVIYELADSVLADIIKEDMSDLDKVFAVFFYARNSFTYCKDNNKWEYKQEAYHMMTTKSDNCYANVCVVKLLLERLGIQSFMIEGDMGDEYPGEHHYWNMVSIDGGNSWYHLDPAWWTWMYDEYPMCMMTDEFAKKISDAHGSFLNWNADEYPATPATDLWTPEEMGFESKYLD